MSGAALTLRGLSKGFGGRALLREAGAQLEAGARATLQGPSGGGKTTLLRMIAGLEPADAGEILLDGAVATRGARVLRPPWERGVQMVFQDLGLWPTRSVRQNVTDAVRAAGLREAGRRADEVLSRLGLGALARRRPAHLSGGEARRLALARALALEPRVLLLDEPFASLDHDARREGFALLDEVLAATDATVLLVTHDAWEAERLGGALWRLEEGRLHA